MIGVDALVCSVIATAFWFVAGAAAGGVGAYHALNMVNAKR